MFFERCLLIELENQRVEIIILQTAELLKYRITRGRKFRSNVIILPSEAIQPFVRSGVPSLDLFGRNKINEGNCVQLEKEEENRQKDSQLVDLNDLWAFNLKTNTWKQITFNKITADFPTAISLLCGCRAAVLCVWGML